MKKLIVSVLTFTILVLFVGCKEIQLQYVDQFVHPCK